jgi:hypothetical protein
MHSSVTYLQHHATQLCDFDNKTGVWYLAGVSGSLSSYEITSYTIHQEHTSIVKSLMSPFL